MSSFHRYLQQRYRLDGVRLAISGLPSFMGNGKMRGARWERKVINLSTNFSDSKSVFAKIYIL